MTPSTPSGRQLVAEFDVGQFGRVNRAVIVIEAEAGREAVEAYRLDLAEKVRALPGNLYPSDWLIARAAVLGLIEGEK